VIFAAKSALILNVSKLFLRWKRVRNSGSEWPAKITRSDP